jgi:hypothetical protein
MPAIIIRKPVDSIDKWTKKLHNISRVASEVLAILFDLFRGVAMKRICVVGLILMLPALLACRRADGSEGWKVETIPKGAQYSYIPKPGVYCDISDIANIIELRALDYTTGTLFVDRTISDTRTIQKETGKILWNERKTTTTEYRYSRLDFMIEHEAPGGYAVFSTHCMDRVDALPESLRRSLWNK